MSTRVTPRPAPVERTPIQSSEKRSTIKKVLYIAGIIVVLLLLFTAVRLFVSSGKMFEGSMLGFLRKGPLQTDEYNRTNIIVFGTTEDSEAHRKIGANQARTDSIMLASIDQEDKTMVLTSVPRDMWVEYGEECANGSEGKINAVYLCGSENGKREEDGARKLMNAVSDVYGLDVHYFVHVNFTGVETMVNAVGGIEVDIESTDPRGIYDPAIGIQLPNGLAELDGKKALLLARARDSTASGYGLAGGNFAREDHQQKIAIAIRDKAVQRGALSNPVTVIRMVDSLGNNVRTNFGSNEIRALVELAQEINEEKIQHVRLNDPENPLVTTGRVAGQSIVKPTSGLFEYSAIHRYMQDIVAN